MRERRERGRSVVVTCFSPPLSPSLPHQLSQRRGNDVPVLVLLDLPAEAVEVALADAALLPPEEDAAVWPVVDEDEGEELFRREGRGRRSHEDFFF